ncbi:MAG: sodium-translocating pyrophosphatase, partial [Candidatus Ranarchaeia archaeon]
MDLLLFPLIVSVLAIVMVIITANSIRKAPKASESLSKVAAFIRQGANAFMRRQYLTEATVLAAIAILFFFVLDIFTTISFLIGAALSLLGGFVGMQVAIRSNLHTAAATVTQPKKALCIAFEGGSVMGLSVIGLSLLGVTGLLIVNTGVFQFTIVEAIRPIIGFGMGASLAALFTQVGGGIFTKGADVGADFVGKVEEEIPEDDPRNPAVIADLVGDNVGDCAGRGSDLFESLSDDIISGMLLGLAFFGLFGFFGVIFPLLSASIGILASILGIIIVRRIKCKNPIMVFAVGLMSTGVIAGAVLYPLVMVFLGDVRLYWAGLTGLAASLLIGLISVYYTNQDFRPVKRLTIGSIRGAPINIIEGLSLAFESPILPVLLIAATIVAAYVISGSSIYGVAMANIGIDLTIGMIMAWDAYGPIADNAGGILEMSGKGQETREVAESLDSLGNTTKAYTKAYAVSSATLSAFVLFATFYVRAGINVLDIINPVIPLVILIGMALPFLLSSMLIGSVGQTAFKIVDEVRRQFKDNPDIMKGVAMPDYAKSIDIATVTALHEMVLPSLLGVVTPILVGFVIGPAALGGFILGNWASIALLGPFFVYSGGAWDNTKKMMEMQRYKSTESVLLAGIIGDTGASAQQAAIVGDTVGDPLKDVAGPSMNIFMKLVNMTALLILP